MTSNQAASVELFTVLEKSSPTKAHASKLSHALFITTRKAFLYKAECYACAPAAPAQAYFAQSLNLLCVSILLIFNSK